MTLFSTFVNKYLGQTNINTMFALFRLLEDTRGAREGLLLGVFDSSLSVDVANAIEVAARLLAAALFELTIP